MDDVKKDDKSLGRRDLMKKLGAGVVATALTGQRTSAQRGRGGEGAAQTPAPPPGSPPPPGEWRPHTGPAIKNDANRLGGNGPMDDTTRKIVKYVARVQGIGHDTVRRQGGESHDGRFDGRDLRGIRRGSRARRRSRGAVVPGRLSRSARSSDTGSRTTPELAAFANSCMVRLVDFNDTPHNSNLIPAALAIGEALHSTGSQVMAAIAVGYEVMTRSGRQANPLRRQWRRANSWDSTRIGWPMP